MIEEIKKNIQSLEDGKEKIYLKEVINNIEKGEVLNISDFISGLKGFNVDVEELRKKEEKANKIIKEWQLK